MNRSDLKPKCLHRRKRSGDGCEKEQPRQRGDILADPVRTICEHQLSGLCTSSNWDQSATSAESSWPQCGAGLQTASHVETVPSKTVLLHLSSPLAHVRTSSEKIHWQTFTANNRTITQVKQPLLHQISRENTCNMQDEIKIGPDNQCISITLEET